MITSLDGYIADKKGNFDWAMPGEEVHSFINEIDHQFEPEAVQQMKASAAQDLAVGGPTLAAWAFKAGLVDACHLFIAKMPARRVYW